MHGYVSDSDVVSIARQRPAWRWTQLIFAIRRRQCCCESTAARGVRRAVRAGLLIHEEAVYRVVENADLLLAAPYCYHRLDRRAFLSIMAERDAWPYTELMDEICVRLDTAETSVMRSFRLRAPVRIRPPQG